jgi:hypothetical protein
MFDFTTPEPKNASLLFLNPTTGQPCDANNPSDRRLKTTETLYIVLGELFATHPSELSFHTA